MNKTLTAKQLAERWGMSKYTLGYMRRNGQGPKFFKTGPGKNSHARYLLADVEEYEREQTERNKMQQSEEK